MNPIAQELRSRINPAYASQAGTESNERRVSAEEIERLEAEVERLTPLQYRQAPCRNQCEAQAFRIDERNLTSALAAMTQSRDTLARELIYIAGISTGQVQRVANAALMAMKEGAK